MDAWIRQIRYSARSLGKDKSFTLTALITLAVCLAANASIFTIVHSVLLRPLPVPESQNILLMSNRYPKAGAVDTSNSSVGDYFDRRKQTSVFEEQAMYRWASQTIDLNGSPELISGLSVTPSLFRLLRAAPAIGRSFSDDEGEIGNDQKVILSHALWQQLYGGDRGAIGKELRLAGRPFVVVGVMPRDFLFLSADIRLWTPLAFTAEQKDAFHNNSWSHIGRLKPGATIAQAQAQIDALNVANLEQFPQFKQILINAGFHTAVERLQDNMVRDVSAALYSLWAGAAFVLLIGCVNLANLWLARTQVRAKEMATRLALGASRAQLTAEMMAEHLLVSLAGGVGGLTLAYGIIRLLYRVGLDRLPRANEVRIDSQVALITLAASVAIGILMALVPLTHVLRANLSSILHEQGRSGTGGTKLRAIRRGLVVVQVGLAFVLLAGAGVLLASFRQLLKVDPGFTTEGVLTVSTSAPRSRYPEAVQLRSLMDRSLAAMRAIPGVRVAGATDSIPFGGNNSDSVILAEGYVMKPGESLVSPKRMVVSPGYFEAMKIAMSKGRAFDERDNERSPAAVIVDDTLARKFWPGGDPIGRRMFQPSNEKDLFKTDAKTRWLTVVGVVRSVRLQSLAGDEHYVGAYYFPYAQSSGERSFTFAVRAEGDMDALTRAIRAEMKRIDPELALFEVQTMARRAELSLASRKTSLLLATGFGVLALFLSAIGIYGVLSYLVLQREREMGIRLALGSTAGGVFGLVLREGVVLVAVGLAAGFAGAGALQSAIAKQVYGVRPLDPLVMGIAILVLATVVLAACAIPARRAMRINPAAMLSQQ